MTCLISTGTFHYKNWMCVNLTGKQTTYYFNLKCVHFALLVNPLQCELSYVHTVQIHSFVYPIVYRNCSDPICVNMKLFHFLEYLDYLLWKWHCVGKRGLHGIDVVLFKLTVLWDSGRTIGGWFFPVCHLRRFQNLSPLYCNFLLIWHFATTQHFVSPATLSMFPIITSKVYISHHVWCEKVA